MDTTMEVAFVGLAGTLVGALISSVIPALLSAHRTAKDKRIAVRLVTDELDTADRMIQHSYTSGSWYFDPELCNTVSWQQYRSTLAEVLPLADFLSLCNGTRAVAIIRSARSHHFDKKATFSIDQEERDMIEVSGPQVNLALNAIKKYAEDEGLSRRQRLTIWLMRRRKRAA